MTEFEFDYRGYTVKLRKEEHGWRAVSIQHRASGHRLAAAVRHDTDREMAEHRARVTINLQLARRTKSGP